MKNSILDNETYQLIRQRIEHLTADKTPLWGKMTANQMVCHLTDPLRVALHLRQVKPAVPFFLRPIIRLMILTEKPWKPNQPTLKPFLQDKGGHGTAPVDFEADKKALLEHLDMFCSKETAYQYGAHPALGKMDRRQYGFFVWKHIDHHLRQFGL